jgi:hypothetical protein
MIREVVLHSWIELRQKEATVDWLKLRHRYYFGSTSLTTQTQSNKLLLNARSPSNRHHRKLALRRLPKILLYLRALKGLLNALHFPPYQVGVLR